MRSIFGSVALVGLSLASGAVFAADPSDDVDETPVGYLDLRAGWSQPVGLQISQGISAPGVAPVNYDWQGENSRGNRGSIGVVAGRNRQNGAFVGAGLSFTRWDTTPSGYTGGTTPPTQYRASNINKFDAKFLAVDLQAGYAAGMRLNDSLFSWLEIAPVVSLGGMSASAELPVTTRWYEVDSGTGFAWEYGIRGGWYISERNWLVGVTGTWARLKSDVTVSHSFSSTSQLRIVGEGFRVGLEAGYRF